MDHAKDIRTKMITHVDAGCRGATVNSSKKGLEKK
jgi:hypothetical protein